MQLIICQLCLSKALSNLPKEKEKEKRCLIRSKSVNVPKEWKKIYVGFGNWLRELAVNSAGGLKDGQGRPREALLNWLLKDKKKVSSGGMCSNKRVLEDERVWLAKLQVRYVVSYWLLSLIPSPFFLFSVNTALVSKLWILTTSPASWEICMPVKKQKLKPDVEQQTGSKLGKEYVKAVYCHPAYFNLYAKYNMWNARLDEAQAGIKIAGENIDKLRYTDDTTLNIRKWRGTEEHFDESKRGEWKSWLKTFKKLRSWHLAGKAMGKQWKLRQTLFSWAPKALQKVTAAMKLKDSCSLEEKLWQT